MREDSEEDDLLECGMSGSHASTLERLYAWERKLYHEVKVAFSLSFFTHLGCLHSQFGNMMYMQSCALTFACFPVWICWSPLLQRPRQSFVCAFEC